MHPATVLWLAACAAGTALSIRSAAVLGAASPATRAGWIASAAYFTTAFVDAIRARPAPLRLDLVWLGVLLAAFVAAGIRDEAQAEPWWWPTGSGRTGAQRRADAAAGR